MYLLNDQGEIVFANEALGAWLSQPPESLESLKCIWTTDPLGNQSLNRVRGLAAPPTAFRQSFCQGQVFRTAADQHLIWRKATFTRLSGTADMHGSILVCVDPTDLPANAALQSSSAPGNPPPTASHIRDLIASFTSPRSRRLKLDAYLGISPLARRLQRQIEVACEVSCNLLIDGPEGSGKEDLARAIHTARNPDEGELSPIHGTFADAQSVQQSVIEIREKQGRAGAWALILDCDQLSPEAIHELCGFLQLPHHQLSIIATCRNPKDIAPELIHHLDTLSLSIPSIRSRKQDLPVLAELLLKQASPNSLIEFHESAIHQLQEYDWPGNLNELRHVMEAIARNATDDLVTPEEFPDVLHHAISAQQIGTCDVPEIQLDQYLESIETQLIERALIQANQNKAKACKLLGISRAKLGRRIQHLNIGASGADPVIFELEENDG